MPVSHPSGLRSRRAARASVLVTALFLNACVASTLDGPAENPFTGCYDNSCAAAPVSVVGVPPLASLSARAYHVCGLTREGEAWCWGDNQAGQLGDGSDVSRAGPVKVAGSARYSSISVGVHSTCALSLDGTVYCWGAGSMLGQPAPDRCAAGPCAKAPLALGDRVHVSLAVGARHVCAVDLAGDAYCWGLNQDGEVGSTDYTTQIDAPLRVSGGPPFTSIAAGNAFTCALASEGRAYCWGAASAGQLGHPAPVCRGIIDQIRIYCTASPGAVATTERFTALTLSTLNACGITSTGRAFCWGDNGQGQLSASQVGGSIGVPAVLHGGLPFRALSLGGSFLCGTPPSTGPTVCWGMNTWGTLGIGTRQELSTTPLPVDGARRFAQIAAGMDHVCALTDDGATYCWGSGRLGQLGRGAMAP